MSTETASYDHLGLRALFAVGLLSVQEWSVIRMPGDPLIPDFLDLMWTLPTENDLADWDVRAQADPVAAFGLGLACSAEVANSVSSCGIAEADFRRIIEALLEIVYSSLYAATNLGAGHEFLSLVLKETASKEGSLPPAEIFRSCGANEGHGWGAAVSPGTRDTWRFHFQRNLS